MQRQLKRPQALLASRKAIALAPDNSCFSQGLAAFLLQDGEQDAVLSVLGAYSTRNRGDLRMLQMACRILGSRNDLAGMRRRIQASLRHGKLSDENRRALQEQLEALKRW